MRFFSLKTAVIASAIGMFGLVGTASAQSVNEEYREWQRAQQRAQQEYYDYQRSGSRSDYRQWQEAQRRAQQEQIEYQQARSGNYNNRYRNNGYYNNGYGTRTNMYRVYRNGSYYETNQRGAELLRQAVNSGYQQGYRQGQMDRSYGRGGSYYGNNIYRTGTYGYQSYVDRSQYQYYFQQGFQRGYEDGYNSRNVYGYRSGNSYNILGTILNGILQLSQ